MINFGTASALLGSLAKTKPLPDGWRYIDEDGQVFMRMWSEDSFRVAVWRWPGLAEYRAAIDAGKFTHDSPEAVAARKNYSSHFYTLDRKRIHEAGWPKVIGWLHQQIGRDLLGEKSEVERRQFDRHISSAIAARGE